jgi:hypothetical protein
MAATAAATASVIRACAPVEGLASKIWHQDLAIDDVTSKI